MTHIEEYYNYLLKNPDRACHKLLVVYKKLVKDIKKPQKVSFFNEISEEEETHTYIFDEKKANRPISFIEKFCRHSKGKWAGKKIKLELWQKAFIQATYGFVDEETGYRKYQKVALLIGRKNGKSTLAAALSLYHMMFDGEGGAECYSIAVKKDQAKIVWEEAKRMRAKSPDLRKRTKSLVSGIYYEDEDASFKALASASDSLDGLNAYFVSADEIHAWKDQNLLDVMYDSMSSREQPLFLETSTMGTVRESVFDDEYEYFDDLIKGYEGLEGGIFDESVLAVIYELDNKSEIRNEKNWFKANPGLGTIKSYTFIRNKIIKAQNKPGKFVNILCKDFNVRETAEEKWLSFEIVENKERIEKEDIYDTYAIGGADLSSTTDLSCATILILKDDKKYVLQKYFIPEKNLEDKIKDDKIPYDKWEKRGLIKLCEGSKVNYSDVTQWFIDMQKEYEINTLWVGYDPWNASYWVDEMSNNNFEMIEVIQGPKTMSNPMKQLYADLQDKNVNYDNNPVLKWCLCNTSIKVDDNDNIRPVKGKRQRARIDGAVSLIDTYCVLDKKYKDYIALMEE